MIYLMVKKIITFLLFIFTSMLLITLFINVKYVNEEVFKLPIIEEKEVFKNKPNNTLINDESSKKVSEMLISEHNKKHISPNIIRETEPDLPPFKIKKDKDLKKNKEDNKIKNQSNVLQDTKSKDLKTHKKISNKKKSVLKIFRVQLGSFKSKARAQETIRLINSKYQKYLEENKLQIFIIKKDNVKIHRVWTNKMEKKAALRICSSLKKVNINCILQIDNE